MYLEKPIIAGKPPKFYKNDDYINRFDNKLVGNCDGCYLCTVDDKYKYGYKKCPRSYYGDSRA